jgi:hypothetical protein
MGFFVAPRGTGRAADHLGARDVVQWREETMESRDGMPEHPGHAPHHAPEHRHAIGPIDRDYRLVVRTVLWVIAGLVFLGFAIWWSLT